MKHFVLFVLIVVFSLGTIIPAAFAFECDMMKKNGFASEMVMDGDMPCHETQDQEKQKQSHCDGLCLCMHLLVNQAQVYPESFVIPESFIMKDVYPFYDDAVFTTSSTPPFKPPIFLS